MSAIKRGKDKIPYGLPGSHRKPGRGRPARYPWLTWLTSGKTFEVEFGTLAETRRAKASIAARVSKVNRQLSDQHGSTGWVAHRITVPRGKQPDDLVTAEVTFWWFPNEDVESPDDTVPTEVAHLFASPAHQTAADQVQSRAALTVPAYGPEYQDRLVAILCPTQYRLDAATLSSPAFSHWKGWQPDHCATCAEETGPVDLGLGEEQDR